MQTAPPPTAQYSVHDGDPGRHRDVVLGLWQGNLGVPERMAAKYEWFYQQCPFGPPMLRFLHQGAANPPIGTCSAGMRRMLWRGNEIRAGVLVDLAVVPEHRSLGPALILQQGMIDSARQGLDLLYGFPNAKAVPVFKRIGYRKLADMVRYTRVVRHAEYLGRRMPTALARILGPGVDLALRLRDGLRNLGSGRLDAGWSSRADARMDELWQRSDHGQALTAIRSREYAQWRFDAAPGGGTRYLLLSARGSKALAAWFATQSRGGTLHVLDFWSVDAATAIPRHYLDALLGAARASGHAAVSVEMATSSERLQPWLDRGFSPRESRPVMGCWSDPENASAEPDLHLTAADEDE